MLKLLFPLALSVLIFAPAEAFSNPLCNEFKRKKRQEFCKCHAENGANIYRDTDGQVRWEHFARGRAGMAVQSAIMACMERKGYKYDRE
jgi:hypothetical protein